MGVFKMLVKQKGQHFGQFYVNMPFKSVIIEIIKYFSVDYVLKGTQ